MKKFWILLALLNMTLVFTLSAQVGLPPNETGALGQLNASPRHGEWVTVAAANGDKVKAWVVYPERQDPAPVVIVVHEIYGLTDWARAVADQLAAEGFIAIAPDFISGKAPGGKGSEAVDQTTAVRLIGALDGGEIQSRIDAAVAYGQSLPAATKKFGIIGFCWGGGISFKYATHNPALAASVVNYGVPPAIQDMAAIRAPVYGFYGGSDARITSTVAQTASDMKSAGKSYQYEIFEGAGHAFYRNQAGMNGANLKATQDGWPKVISFLKRQLEAMVSMSEPKPAEIGGFLSHLEVQTADQVATNLDTENTEADCCPIP